MEALVGFLRRNNGQRRRLRRPRDFRDRINPLEIRTDHELFERYRFRRATLIFICDMIADTLSHRTRRSMALPPMLQLLVFLRFVATSAFHQLIGDAVHVSKATAGRCICCHRRCCRKTHPLSNRTEGIKREKEMSCHSR